MTELEKLLNSPLLTKEKIVRKLKDKAREDFETWNINRNLEEINKYRNLGSVSQKVSFEDLSPNKHLVWDMEQVYLNALIIEWLDTVNLKTTVGITQGDMFRAYLLLNSGRNSLWIEETFQNRQAATEAVIIKANELYNERV